MKKFKFRFSYFLILGFIGLIFQMIGFFSWKNIDVTQSQLITSSTVEHFDLYMKHNYFVIVSALLLIVLSAGLILCSKKDAMLLKIGGYTLGISQLVIIVLTIVYLTYVSKNRVDMFKTDEEYTVYKTIGTLVNLKYTALTLSYIGLLSTSLGLISNKKEDKITRLGGYIGTVTNGLMVVAMLTTLISGMFNYSFDLVNGFITFSQKIAEPYDINFFHTNGFTLGQLNRVFMLVQEVDSYATANLGKLYASSIIALITLIVNVIRPLAIRLFNLTFKINIFRYSDF